jgi:hypothetical protein
MPDAAAPDELACEPVRIDAIQPLSSLSADEMALLEELLGGANLRAEDLVVYEVRERPSGKLRKIVATRADDHASGILVTPQGFHRSRTRFGTVAEISISLTPRLVVTDRDLSRRASFRNSPSFSRGDGVPRLAQTRTAAADSIPASRLWADLPAVCRRRRPRPSSVT